MFDKVHRWLSTQIAHPEDVEPGMADWFVRLNIDTDATRVRGGGVLVGDGTWVLTAGHVCHKDPPKYAYLRTYFRLDLKSSTNRAEIIGKPRFAPGFNAGSTPEPGWIANDLALLKIDKQGPALRLASSVPSEGTEGRIYGWGRSEKNQKKMSRRLRTNKPPVLVEEVRSRSFTATSMACTGDSGAPFIVNGEVAGIYSGDGQPKECSAGSDAFTSVAEFHSWIKSLLDL